MPEMTCPHCNVRLRWNFTHEKLMCPECDYSPLDAKMEEARANPREHVNITHRGEVNPHALSAFRTAHDYLYQENQAKAIEALNRAVHFQRDFADAHLWLAKLSDDEAVKREHLGVILAFDGSHTEALRMLMVLNGRLTEEEAARTHHHNDQTVLEVVGAVESESEALLCPVCGGHMTIHEGQAECKFCGHTEEHKPRTQIGSSDSLAMALMERKAQPVKWVVAERILHCEECGAERTIPARKLSEECPFCGSTHVIQTDALGSFEQPDSLVPFRLTRQQAATRIKTELQGLRHRLVRIFDDNRIKRGTLDPIYLPFWTFDVVSRVVITKTYTGTSRNGRVAGVNIQQLRTEENVTDALYDLPICAVTSPPAEMTGRLGDYDLEFAVPYESNLLAKYPAQLYSIDFDEASLAARGIAAKAMRSKYGAARETGEEQMKISVFSTVQQMNFQLVLLPVWVANITEEDGDKRSALVNGQTGKVVLGKTIRHRG